MITNESYKLKYNYIAFLLFLSLISCKQVQGENLVLSPMTYKALERFQNIEENLGTYEETIGQSLLNCSYVQDAWLSFLHDAEGKEEFHRGMELFENYTHRFHSICNYTTTVLNFYTGELTPPHPQQKAIEFNGQQTKGFLNTFKKRAHLTEEERDLFFEEEVSKYLAECLVKPFILDETTIHDLQPETIYNYVLLPHGTVITALEKPGRKDYQVCDLESTGEAFQYPNHTILAGHPQQVVVTAGSFIFYQVDQKKLFFVSCKSGHFQPTYHSLDHMRTRLKELGIHPSAIIKIPDVDLSQVTLKTYQSAKVSLTLSKEDAEKLFYHAQKRWQDTYQKLDKTLLHHLAEGNLSVLNSEVIQELNQKREEATYMRSAYHLFSFNHYCPKTFHRLVKSFGKLKDAIKHQAKEKIPFFALSLLELMKEYEKEDPTIIPANEESTYHFLTENISLMLDLLSKEEILIEEYHYIKKFSRELGTLFKYLSDEVKWKGNKYFIFNTASETFFQINEMMAAVHDDYISQLLHGEVDKEDSYFVRIHPKIADQLNRCLTSLDICPPSFFIEIDPSSAWKMINWVKEWYFTHALFIRDEPRKGLNIHSLLQDYIHDDVENKNYADPLAQLYHIKRDAERAKHVLIFLDKSHQSPELIDHYIEHIGCIIQALEEGNLKKAHQSIAFLLDVSEKYSHPTQALENWECTDQNSFNRILDEHLAPLNEIQEDHSFTLEKASQVLENMKAFRDLISAFGKYGVLYQKDSSYQKPPKIYYDVLEEHAMVLIKEIENALKDRPREVIPSSTMVAHAQFILTKIQLTQGKTMEPVLQAVPVTLLLCRHGEAQGTGPKGKDITGSGPGANVPLTEEGVKQAKKWER